MSHAAAHLRLAPRRRFRVAGDRGDVPRRLPRQPPGRRRSSSGTCGTGRCPPSGRPPRPRRWRSSPALSPQGDEARGLAAADRHVPAFRRRRPLPVQRADVERRVPYILKQFIDVVSQPGLVFGFDPERGLHRPAAAASKAAVIYTSAVYGPGRGPAFGADFQAPVLRGLAALGRRRRRHRHRVPARPRHGRRRQRPAARRTPGPATRARRSDGGAGCRGPQHGGFAAVGVQQSHHAAVPPEAANRGRPTCRAPSLIFNPVLTTFGDVCDGLADVVAGGGVSVAGAGWASGAGSAGFRRAGGQRGCRADVPKPAADSGRGEPARCGGPFPGAAQVGDEGAGQAELGVRGDDQPGPAVAGVGVAELRAGPAEGLLEQPEGVFQVEAAQEGLPPAVHVGRGGAGGWRSTATPAWGRGRRADARPAAGSGCPR